MLNWQDDQLQMLLSCKNEHTLFEALATTTRELGFNYCAYGLVIPLPVTRPQIVMHNNYPWAWQERYKANNYFNIDPTVQHGLSSSLPIMWSDKLFTSARVLWEEAHSFGLRVGWAQANRDAHGTTGMLTLARAENPLSAEELRDKALKMVWLAQIAHIGMSEYIRVERLPEAQISLTDRETEVLRWTADGKTAGEISHILGITERTVNFHINNAGSGSFQNVARFEGDLGYSDVRKDG